MTDHNPFLAYAAKVQPWAAKKKARAAEREMNRAQKKAMIKALSERDLLLRLWKKWRNEVLHAELEGPYEKDIQLLINALNKMSLEHEKRLINIIRKGPWLAAPPDIRFLVLHLIDARLIVLNEKADLPPFNDALPGEPLTPFQIIRAHLMEKTR
jgi:hypothetical protein